MIFRKMSSLFWSNFKYGFISNYTEMRRKSTRVYLQKAIVQANDKFSAINFALSLDPFVPHYL